MDAASFAPHHRSSLSNADLGSASTGSIKPFGSSSPDHIAPPRGERPDAQAAEALPTMSDLDRMEADLDALEHALAAIDDVAPDDVAPDESSAD